VAFRGLALRAVAGLGARCFGAVALFFTAAFLVGLLFEVTFAFAVLRDGFF
jgi:hypothetical protein